jgi:hypothetical protein
MEPARNGREDLRLKQTGEGLRGCLAVRQKMTRIEVISSALRDVGGLRSLLPFGDFEFHRIAFLQTLIAFRTNGAVMHKYIGAIRPPDESITFRVIEPLDRTFQPFHA